MAAPPAVVRGVPALARWVPRRAPEARKAIIGMMQRRAASGLEGPPKRVFLNPEEMAYKDRFTTASAIFAPRDPVMVSTRAPKFVDLDSSAATNTAPYSFSTLITWDDDQGVTTYGAVVVPTVPQNGQLKDTAANAVVGAPAILFNPISPEDLGPMHMLGGNFPTFESELTQAGWPNLMTIDGMLAPTDRPVLVGEVAESSLHNDPKPGVGLPFLVELSGVYSPTSVVAWNQVGISRIGRAGGDTYMVRKGGMTDTHAVLPMKQALSRIGPGQFTSSLFRPTLQMMSQYRQRWSASAWTISNMDPLQVIAQVHGFSGSQTVELALSSTSEPHAIMKADATPHSWGRGLVELTIQEIAILATELAKKPGAYGYMKRPYQADFQPSYDDGSPRLDVTVPAYRDLKGMSVPEFRKQFPGSEHILSDNAQTMMAMFPLEGCEMTDVKHELEKAGIDYDCSDICIEKTYAHVNEVFDYMLNLKRDARFAAKAAWFVLLWDMKFRQFGLGFW